MLSVVAFVASTFIASHASATQAIFKYRVCFVKSVITEEGQEAVKKRIKFRRVYVDGLNSLHLTYTLNNNFAFPLKTKILDDRNRLVLRGIYAKPALRSFLPVFGFPDTDTYTVNKIRVKGERIVSSDFQKAVDWWTLKANFTYDQGDFSGLTYDVKLRFFCKKEGKRQ